MGLCGCLLSVFVAVFEVGIYGLQASGSHIHNIKYVALSCIAFILDALLVVRAIGQFPFFSALVSAVVVWVAVLVAVLVAFCWWWCLQSLTFALVSFFPCMI